MKSTSIMGLFMYLILCIIIITPVVAKDLINETETINEGEYASYSFSGEEFTEIELRIEVTSGGAVDMLFMNELGYDLYSTAFASNESSTLMFYTGATSLNVTEDDRGIELPVTQTYYVVIENADFVDGGASPTGTVKVKLLVTTKEEEETPGFEWLGVGFAILLTGVVVVRLKK